MKIATYTMFMFCEYLWHMDSICEHFNSIFSEVLPLKLVIKHMPAAVVDTTEKWLW